MAMPSSEHSTIIGVDVAKAELVIYEDSSGQLSTIANNKTAIKQWIKALHGKVSIAIEATNVDHLLFTDMVHEAGHTLYLMDGYALSHYRKGIGSRAKTDPIDARVLARYLKNEGANLTPWIPPSTLYRDLVSLFRRRAMLVQTRTALRLSWEGEPLLKNLLKSQLTSMKRLEDLIENMIKKLLDQAGLMPLVKQCMKVEGVGFLTAARLVATYQRGEFKSADAFIAFLGMDLRVAQSGKKKERSTLTKRGDPEVRRLLHNAAMSAGRTAAWKTFYEDKQSRGFKKTQVLVMLARKLARVVFVLIRSGEEYRPKAA